MIRYNSEAKGRAFESRRAHQLGKAACTSLIAWGHSAVERAT
jgi:hypothetical protein